MLTNVYQGNGHATSLADPSCITREECVELARCGVDAWNRWREANPSDEKGRNVADFSGISIHEEALNFSGFNFGDGARFDGAQFFGHALFASAVFGRGARFSGATFESLALFSGGQFGDGACFDAVVFKSAAVFKNSTFGSALSFEATIFCTEADFSCAVMGRGAKFHGIHVSSSIDFSGAVFSALAEFTGAIFEAPAYFSGTAFSDFVGFELVRFGAAADFRAQTWDQLATFYGHNLKRRRDLVELRGGSTENFYRISFSGACFRGRTDFSGRRFEGETLFGPMRRIVELRRPAQVDGRVLLDGAGRVVWEGAIAAPGAGTAFEIAPHFHECKLHQNTSFEGTTFPSSSGEESAARAYRTLKLAFAQQQATREEQRFFRLEMAEEALMALPLHTWLATWRKRRRQARTQQVEMLPPRFLYWFYAASSHFGFSIARPLALLFALWALAGAAYGFQADLSFCGLRGVGACNKTASLFQFTIGNALPGFEKFAEPAGKVLFGEQLERLGVWTVLTLLLHKTVSVLALFLAGLALRNLFKMK